MGEFSAGKSVTFLNIMGLILYAAGLVENTNGERKKIFP